MDCSTSCRCSRPGGPNTYRLAPSMKGKDKNSPSGGRTEALPADRPSLPSGEEPSASPLAGRRRRQPLSGLHIARAVAYFLPQEVGGNQWKAAHSWGHQRHGEGKGCSCDRASRRCHENSSTDIFGSSTMAAPLRREPFPGRGPGTMPVAKPPTSSSLGKALSGIERGLPPLLGRRR
jgi:hypothetical protein